MIVLSVWLLTLHLASGPSSSPSSLLLFFSGFWNDSRVPRLGPGYDRHAHSVRQPSRPCRLHPFHNDKPLSSRHSSPGGPRPACAPWAVYQVQLHRSAGFQLSSSPLWGRRGSSQDFLPAGGQRAVPALAPGGGGGWRGARHRGLRMIFGLIKFWTVMRKSKRRKNTVQTKVKTVS